MVSHSPALNIWRQASTFSRRLRLFTSGSDARTQPQLKPSPYMPLAAELATLSGIRLPLSRAGLRMASFRLRLLAAAGLLLHCPSLRRVRVMPLVLALLPAA